MGKKASKRGSFPDSGQDCDASSLASSQTTWTTCRPEFAEEEDANDPFYEAVDLLTEKRGSTREAALATLLDCYRQEVRADDAAQNQSTIIGRCVNGLRRGGAAEAALSAQLYALHIITLPEQDESNFLEAQFQLQKSAAHGASVEVRVAAVEALALGCFVSVEDDAVRTEVMERLRALWARGGGAGVGGGTSGAAADARTATAALRGWGLLVTSLDAPLPASTLEGVLAQLATLLHATSVEVRAAAGEVLSLVYSRAGSHARRLLQSLAEEDEADYEEDEEEEHAAGEGHGTGDQEDEVMGDAGTPAAPVPDPALLSRMRQLAVAHPSADALRRSKRDRTAQRAAFRSILASVERGGSVAAVKVKLQHGSTLVVDTVEGSARLAAFRRALAGGFQVHLQNNPLLHSVFSFTPATGPKPRLSALEKKATRSSNSADAKWRTADRKGGRAQKSMMQGGDDGGY